MGKIISVRLSSHKTTTGLQKNEEEKKNLPNDKDTQTNDPQDD